MDLVSLEVHLRPRAGKGAAHAARRNGRVPAVVYGEDQPPVAVTVDWRQFDKVIHGKGGEHAVLQLVFPDNPEYNGPAIVQHVQHHPVSGAIVHADFLRIRLDRKIHTRVPVVLVGRCKGVVEGGIADQQLHELEIECLALDVPESIEVDITDLAIGQSLHVSDLPPSEKYAILTEPERTIVAVHAPKVAKTQAEGAGEQAAAEAAPEENKPAGEKK